MNNNATASKDRTSLFANKPYFKLSPEVGQQILSWCNEGLSPQQITEAFKERINNCKSLKELLQLFAENPTEDRELLQCFSNRRAAIEGKTTTQQKLNHTTKTTNNGTYNNSNIKS